MKLHVDPRLLSASVDKAIFTHIAAVLKKRRNAFCSNYFTNKIDYTNVLSVLRARALGWDETDLAPMLAPGGRLDEPTLLAALSAAEEQLPALLASGFNAEGLRRALELYRSSSFEAARDQIDESLLALALEGRYDSFGIGPIAWFILASESECRTLRVLFAKKRADRANA